MNKISANKKLLLVVCLLFLPNLVSAVEIHQVYYNPVNSESGGEAVEFFNPHPFDVDISGWELATESSLKDAVFPANSSIPANDYFLLADDNWDERKDNSNWRSADFTTPITLSNSDSGIALVNSTGSTVDAVGWGSAQGIDAGLFIGSPCSGVSQGKALLRVNNTDDNFNDFIGSEPDFFGGNVVPVVVNVSDSVSSSARILEGSSIVPVPGENLSIHVWSDKQLSATLFENTVSMEQVNNNTFEAVFDIPFYTAPGNYTIVFSDSSSLEFEIQELRKFEVIADTVGFSVVPGGSGLSRQKVRVKNQGNVDLVFSLDLIDDSLDSAVFEYSFNNGDFFGFDELFEIAPGSSAELNFRISVPDSMSLGKYKSLIGISTEN